MPQSDPNNLKLCPGWADLCHASRARDWFGDPSGYSYYDQRREQDERHQFYHRVHDIAEKLRRITLRPWLNLADVVKETAKSYSLYLEMDR